MSVIAPNFKLSGFIKSIIDDVVWTLLIVSLIGLPVIMMILFVIPMPVIDGELLTPFLAFTYLADPSRTLPIVQAFMTTDMFKVMAFPGFGFKICQDVHDYLLKVDGVEDVKVNVSNHFMAEQINNQVNNSPNPNKVNELPKKLD